MPVPLSTDDEQAFCQALSRGQDTLCVKPGSGPTVGHMCEHVSCVLLPAGIPSDILDSYPSLKAFRNSVATIPEIQQYYAAATDDVRRNGYTPDPQ